MKWEKCSTKLAAIPAAATTGSSAQKRMMFVCPEYFINGNMVTGVHQPNIILRLSEADRRSILKEFNEAAPFEPVSRTSDQGMRRFTRRGVRKCCPCSVLTFQIFPIRRVVACQRTQGKEE
ncbi:MAG: hypothetical protein TUN42_01880 [Dehalogenimonas sp.]